MQRYFSDKLIDNKFILNDDDIYHIKVVMRMTENEKVEVVYNSNVYLCCIHYVNNNVNVEIKEQLECAKSKEPEVTLILPFLKEQKMDLILQKSTELGVKEIILTNFEHSIIKLDDKKTDNKLIRWKKIMKEASEQSMRTDIPDIRILSKKEIFLLDGLKVICSTKEKNNNIRNVLKNKCNYDKIFVAIGPEGGFSQNEENEYSQNGFIKISLGNQILRVETVPIFVLSAIRYEFME